MRESSYNLSKQNSQQPKDIRGGEKKVMKKSLSAILSMAMAFSMFSSVALAAEVDATKDSSSFTDLKDLDAATKAKFDAMIKAGVFDGVKDGVFGVNDKMNRAQFAKVAALIFGLKVDSSLKTSSFSDVKSDDPANGYALPFIEAVKAAGITDGYAPGQFNPAGEVTKEQLATFLVRGLGGEALAKASAGVNDKTVSDWAKGYVAVALDKKILVNGKDGVFGGTSAALRSELVLGAYEAKNAAPVNTVTNVSINKAEVTGAKTVTVTLNGAIADTSKLNVSVARGTTAQAGTVKWNDAKNVATITLDTKVSAGTYTAKIEAVKDGGLTVDKGSVDVTAQDEKIAKLEFINANDTVASAPKVRVQLKATNQYGEDATFAAGTYNVTSTANSATMKKDDSGKLFVELDTQTGGSAQLSQNISQISVNIYNNDSQISATKIFKLGTTPYPTKVELGTPVYSNGKGNISSAGDKVVIPMTQYDQYGNVITVDSKPLSAPTATVTPYYEDLAKATDDTSLFKVTTSGGTDVATDFIGDDNNDGYYDAIVKLKTDAKVDGDYSLTIFAGSSATATIKIGSTKTAAKVTIDSSVTLAKGDVDKYIPITAYDKSGNALSVDDLINAVDKGQLNINVGGVTLGASNAITGDMLTKDANKALVKVGEHKGQIHVASVPTKGTANVYVYANATNANQPTFSANAMINIVDTRYPASLKSVVDNAPKGLAGIKGADVNNLDQWNSNFNGATTGFKLGIFDQYGEEMKDANLGTPFLDSNNKNVSYFVNAKVVTNDVYAVRDANGAQVQDKTKVNGTLVGRTDANGAPVYLYNQIILKNDNASNFNTTNPITSYNLNKTNVLTPQYDPTTGTGNVAFAKFAADNNSGVAETAATGAPLGDLTGPTNNIIVANQLHNYKWTFDTTHALPGQKMELKFSLVKYDVNANKVIDESVSTITKKFEVVDPTKTDLTYTVNKVADLYNAQDSGALTLNNIFGAYNFVKKKNVAAADFSWARVAEMDMPLGRKISLKAVDSAGNTVAVPDSIIKSVSSSDPSKVTVSEANDFLDTKGTQRWIIGNKAGTAKVGVVYIDPKDNTQKQLFADVNVKDASAYSITKLTAATSKTVSRTNPFTGTKAYNAFDLMSDVNTQLVATDSFGQNFDSLAKQAYAQELLGLSYSISNVTSTDGSIPTVSFQNGVPVISNIDNVQGFTITVAAPSGVTASTAVIVSGN
ncbi:S-layer homology domain-containing protein [Paenibacillus cremeus]|uniref:SLH domain-containing protein n=1 Tax=Paenibacillus cremeus TaxID=2163881 RepID=A0A559KB17_9BACL|nr:S-layer homology domain-containing protein [Paenibacillus cremeus]TVY09322.1 hypothetical protein FPZ49_14135 [Paenibacillus cremeus]